MDRIYDWRRLGWLCLPVVPLGLLILEAVRWSSHALNYPQYFNNKCMKFGEDYPGAESISDLILGNAIWLSPAVPLMLLWNRRRVALLYTVVCLIFASIVSAMVSEDLTGNVNCYRDIVLGEVMIALCLLAQTFILLVGSLVAFIRSAIRWCRAPLHMEPFAP